ncbi:MULTISPECIES: hypothetical protein [unclassified Janthinobacterium]|uniref:hypothetical protein n=1 Tax=unclassified Janthinobacterium TaxID=2610881 RepID=UPI000349C76A|nr:MULTISPECIES: hypothetical protein [unclassified Janthinobacterium]MEC5163725.1 hypothetical protein [Janthinobacterium sp. CG_S6]
MKRFYTWRRWLFAPLVYLAALCLLFEECLWDVGARLMRWVAQFPPLRALESGIARLPPYWALTVFALPAVLLFPVKLLALLAIARGHPFSGVCVIVVAKLAGAAAVARLYSLTRPALLSLPWFARWHGKFIAVKNDWIGRLRATRAWRRVDGLAALLGAARRNWWAARRARAGRLSARPARVLRRFAAFWRARRRP